MEKAIEFLKAEFADGEFTELMSYLNRSIKPELETAMIKYALFHVRRALESANNHVKCDCPIEIGTILASYGIENIK